MKAACFPLLAAFTFMSAQVEAQTEKTIRAAVTYISSGSIYLDGGRGKGLAQGDTVIFTRGAVARGKGFIIAVSSSSSAVHFLDASGGQGTNGIAVGDSASITKTLPAESLVPATQVAAAVHPAVQTELPSAQAEKSRTGPLDNDVTGRVAFQYAQAGTPGMAPDFSQPSLYTRLNVVRLLGTGMNFSFFARTYQNAALRTYGDGGRTKFRLYDMSLSYDEPESNYGWNAGRITSVFMGGLGQVDGAQAYVKTGGFAFGVLGGLQPDYLTSGVDSHQQKGAFFAHYGWEGERFTRWDATIAYGRQWFNGKLDRDFLYVQNSARLGTDLFLYQSSEIDMHVMENGARVNKFRLTNTYATLSYVPASWLSVSAGFDATRNIYLLESMKSIPDTLFDHTLREGYRAALSIRIPMNIILTTTGRYRPATETERKSWSLGGGARIIDLAGTGINLGGQYNKLVSVYTDGKDLTFDADDWITRDICLTLRYDRYAYTVTSVASRYVSTTGTANVQWRLSRTLFLMLNYDKVWDSLRDSERLMGEFGVRF